MTSVMQGVRILEVAEHAFARCVRAHRLTGVPRSSGSSLWRREVGDCLFRDAARAADRGRVDLHLLGGQAGSTLGFRQSTAHSNVLRLGGIRR